MKESSVVDIGVIEDVGIGTKQYISQKWGKKFYWIGGILALPGLFALFKFGIPHALIISAIWFFVGFAIAHKRVRREFLKQFATKNGFTYEDRAPISSVSGDLFGRGDSRSIDGVVAGMHAQLPLRFFFYSYTTGSGKNRSTHSFTVAEVVFGGALPDIIVDSKDDMYVDGGFFGRHKSLELGNGFDDYFTLKVPEDLEIEALEVFTPEIMEQLMGRGRGYSFEFIGTKLYVWNTGTASTSAELRELLSLAQFLIDALAPRLARLSDDIQAHYAVKNGK